MGNDRDGGRVGTSGTLADRVRGHLEAADELLRESDQIARRAAARVSQARQRLGGRLPEAPLTAGDRFLAVKQRELAAHRSAIELHERAATLQDRLGHPDRAVDAREHADHARELYRQAWEELAQYETRRTTDRT